MQALSAHPHIAAPAAKGWKKNQLWAPGTVWSSRSATHVLGRHPYLSQKASEPGNCFHCAQLTWKQRATKTPQRLAGMHRLKAAEQVFCFGYFFIAKWKCAARDCLVFWEILKMISKHINLLAQCKHMHISPPGDWTAVYLCVSPVIDCRPFHGALPLALWQLTPCDPESDRKTDGLMDGEMDGWMTFREQA